MRTTGFGMAIVIALAAGCGGAMDGSSETTALRDAQAHEEAAPNARPVVGTLRMRDRDVLLTADVLDATGHEELREMTAQAASAPVMADIDERHTGDRRAEPIDLTRIQAGLDF